MLIFRKCFILADTVKSDDLQDFGPQSKI